MSDEVGGLIVSIIYLAIIVTVIIGMGKVFIKAGQPGWACIIPIVNLYFLCKIAGRPGWWVILCLIPFINWIFLIIITNDISKSFGKGIGTTLGLIFLPFIFYPVLGFGDAQYQGPAAAS
mgnify:CR=1 FL=1|jgi:hypothetical protein